MKINQHFMVSNILDIKKLKINLLNRFFNNYFWVLMIALLLPITMTAQSETVYQNWTMIQEDEEIMIEVSGKVLKCNLMGSAQLFIEIFNESSIDQVAHFNLTLKNPQTNEEETHEISLPVLKGKIEKPDCGNNDHPSLRLNIPNGWDPETVKYSLIFTP